MRSILMSLMVIGATGAVMFGAATFAGFTTSGSDAGTITAATLSIEVKGSGPSLNFDLFGGTTDCDNIVPDDVCDDLSVKVTNNSGVGVKITEIGIVETGTLESCASNNSLVTSVSGLAVNDTIAAAAFIEFGIETTFAPTGSQALIDTCQGAAGLVTITITVENTP